MIAHLLALSLYLISVIVYYIAFYKVNKYPDSVKATIFGLRAWDVSVVINFCS
jgi:hypothetical protein